TLLVSIDKYQIKSALNRWNHVGSITDVIANAIGVFRFSKITGYALKLFFVDINAVQHTVSGEPFGQTQRSITCECSNLQSELGRHQLAQHRQDASLIMSRKHMGHRFFQIGLSMDPAEQVRFGVASGF